MVFSLFGTVSDVTICSFAHTNIYVTTNADDSPWPAFFSQIAERERKNKSSEKRNVWADIRPNVTSKSNLLSSLFRYFLITNFPLSSSEETGRISHCRGQTERTMYCVTSLLFIRTFLWDWNKGQSLKVYIKDEKYHFLFHQLGYKRLCNVPLTDLLLTLTKQPQHILLLAINPRNNGHYFC